ncbi:MAG: pyrimidine/purine nucleoside phosphorylase [Cocleimonas sp.]
MFKTNEYFDGNVKSIAFTSKTGAETLPATVGVMAIGDYVFNTGDKEKMTVVSGAMTIKFAGATEAQTFTAGESFEVGANSSFDVSIAVETAYLCLYG